MNEMDEKLEGRLESIVLTESNEYEKNPISNNNEPLLKNKKEKCICCFSSRWCFENVTPGAYKIYNENDYLCCPCLDCGSWCLEFQYKKSECCKKNIICFMCCCIISFQ